jgi:DNA polymerase-3 subunit beta
VRLTLPAADLAQAVTFAARALPSRPPTPVLAGLLLRAGDDTLRVTAFDQELAATAATPAAVAEPGTTLVPGRLLADIAARLPDGGLTVHTDATRLRLSGGGVRFTLALLPAGDYPALPTPPGPAGQVDTATLAAALAQVGVAAGRDETLPVLTALSLRISGDRLSLAATDRYRVATRTLALTPVAGPVEATALVPARPLLALARALDGPACEIGAGSGLLALVSPRRQVLLRQIEAPALDYEGRIPARFATRAELPARALADAVARVALAAAPTAPVRLAFSPGRVRVEAATGEHAEAVEDIDAAVEGTPMAAAYTPRYLTDLLGVLDGDRVVLHLTSATTPTLVTGAGDGGLRYLVAPRRAPA